MTHLTKLFKSLSSNYAKSNNITTLKPILETYYGYDWNDYKVYEKNKYSKNLILEDENISMYLFYWDKYVKSPIDIKENNYIMRLLKGNLYKRKYINLDENYKIVNENLMNKNSIFSQTNPNFPHTFQNVLPYPTVSLHIYTKK